MDRFDVCIAGAGVIGLAIARQLALSPQWQGRKLLLLDAGTGFGQYTSSRSSEVIHAGIYYPRNSLKARLCVRGNLLLYAYCRQRDIPHRRLGKLIVAQPGDEAQLAHWRQQALANGVEDLRWLDKPALNKAAPYLRGSAALLSPSTGIIDSHRFMQALLGEAEQSGLLYVPRTPIERVQYQPGAILVHTRTPDDGSLYTFQCGCFINSAGLQAQALAHRVEGIDAGGVPALHLCKGDYFAYSGRHPFAQLVYPLPETNTRGLGIHATLDMGSQLRFGPDAEYIEHLDYDVNAAKAEPFARAIARYYPDIDTGRLHPAYAGIRPKLTGPGAPPADFAIQFMPDSGAAELVQLFGIESPGLTASLALAEYVQQRLAH